MCIPLCTNWTIQDIKLLDSKSSLKSTSGTFTLAIIPTHSIMHSISFKIVTKWAKFPISSCKIHINLNYFIHIKHSRSSAIKKIAYLQFTKKLVIIK